MSSHFCLKKVFPKLSVQIWKFWTTLLLFEASAISKNILGYVKWSRPNLVTKEFLVSKLQLAKLLLMEISKIEKALSTWRCIRLVERYHYYHCRTKEEQCIWTLLRFLVSSDRLSTFSLITIMLEFKSDCSSTFVVRVWFFADALKPWVCFEVKNIFKNPVFISYVCCFALRGTSWFCHGCKSHLLRSIQGWESSNLRQCSAEISTQSSLNLFLKSDLLYA